MATCARSQLNAKRHLPFCAAILAVGLATPAAAQTEGDSDWVLPRTEHGHPDLQGNWTNATMTPVQRPEGLGAALTAEQIAAWEGARQETIDADAARSDPDRCPQ